MTIQKCPICEGKGIVPKGFYEVLKHSKSKTEACRACYGVGTINSFEFKVETVPEIFRQPCTYPYIELEPCVSPWVYPQGTWISTNEALTGFLINESNN